MTPDGNFTITLAPGASEGRVDFTALVDWPTNLIPFTPGEPHAAGRCRSRLPAAAAAVLALAGLPW